MTTWNKDTVDNMLKQFYNNKKVADACYNQKQLVAVNPSAIGIKHKKAVGNSFISSIRYAESGGMATTVAAAQTYQLPASSEKWIITPDQRLYKSDAITTDAILTATGDPNGAFFNATVDTIAWARNTLTVEFEKALFRANSQLGAVGSATATVVTLSNVADSRNFVKGMTISNAAGSATEVITGVNREDGTLTMADTTGFTVAATAIYRAGIVSPGFNGFAAHFPKASLRTGSTTVQNVDVSQDWERLAGTAYDATGSTPYEALIDGLMRSQANGGSPSVGIMSHENFASFLNDAMAQRLFTDSSKATLGFKQADIAIPGGMLKIVASQFIENDVIYCIDPEDIKIVHWGPELMYTLNLDNSVLHMSPTADSWEVRHLILADLFVETPIKHLVVEL